MMEAAKGAGVALLNDSTTHDQDRYVPAVYFDCKFAYYILRSVSVSDLYFWAVFAARLVLFRLESLYIFNILFLILGPILLAGLYFIDAVIKAARKRREGSRHPEQHHPSLLTRIFTDFRLIWRWAKFWVAIIVTTGVQALLILIFIKANPYVCPDLVKPLHIGYQLINSRRRSSTLTRISSFSALLSSVSSRSHGPSRLTFPLLTLTLMTKPKRAQRARRKPSFSNLILSLGFSSYWPRSRSERHRLVDRTSSRIGASVYGSRVDSHPSKPCLRSMIRPLKLKPTPG